MTEREKMQNRKLYDANDRALCADRVRAKELCHAYKPAVSLGRSWEAGDSQAASGENGRGFLRDGPVLVRLWLQHLARRALYANHNLVILDCAAVTFGDHVFVAPNCGFYTAGHPIDATRRELGLEYAYPITVGDHVWIGGGVQVMPGVTIGSNVVIGGGSVVVRDIPSDSVAVGNPCRVIRPITEADKQTCWDR